VSSNLAGSIGVSGELSVKPGRSGACDGEMKSGVGAGTFDGGGATGRTCWIADPFIGVLGMTIFSLADPRFSKPYFLAFPELPTGTNDGSLARCFYDLEHIGDDG